MKKTRTIVILIVSIAILAIAAYYVFSFVIPPRLNPNEFETSMVSRGQVVKTIEAEGVVEPENEVLLRSSTSGVIQRILNSPGSHVKQGEVILLMDTAPVIKQIENAEDQLEVMKNNLVKNRLNARSTKVDLDYTVETKKLKIASIKSDLEDQKQLLEVGGISPARLAKTEQELVLAEKELETILQKNSIRLKQLQAEEEGMLLQIKIKEKELEDKREVMKQMTIKAPSSGIVLNVYGKEGEQFKAGDLLVQMSNMTSFKINGSIDEKQADNIKTGKSVLVSLDNQDLPGKIGRVKPVIENNKVNFDVYLEQSSHPNLIPNQKLEMRVITDRRDSVLRVHKGNAFDNSEWQNAFVIKGNKAVRIRFNAGLAGMEYIEVISGLEEGTRVITSDVSSFRHMREIEIPD